MNKFRNANMQHKSAIQMLRESNEMALTFRNSLQMLTENYTIKGNVFGIMNGRQVEVQDGYFVIESEHDTLDSAIQEMKSFEYCIRINEDKFQVGTVHEKLYECDREKTIINIETQTEC